MGEEGTTPKQARSKVKRALATTGDSDDEEQAGERSECKSSKKGAKKKKTAPLDSAGDEITSNNEVAKCQRVWRKACNTLASQFAELMPQCDELLNQAKPKANYRNSIGKPGSPVNLHWPPSPGLELEKNGDPSIFVFCEH